MKITWETWRLAVALCLGFLIGGVIASTRCHAQHPAPPVVTSVNLGRDMTPTTEPMSVSAEGKYIPAFYGGMVCTETCPSNHPAYTEWHCSDNRRVLVTTEGGVHLCILFPEPPVVPPGVKVKLPTPKPPKPVPVKLSPPPYDGQR